MAVYEQIAPIDGGLKAGQPPAEDTLEQLQAALVGVLEDIDRLGRLDDPPSQTSTQRLEPDVLRERLLQLAHALEYDLGAAEPLLEELKVGVAGTPMEAAINNIAGLVDVFDIDAAQEQLRSLGMTDTGPAS